ncbi:MAG: ATPase domain-containing protein [Candidatus Poseidoniaceae archaeon]|nr:ATPase domain-containing protein [Candidatus Poseidoniaceae archaeon]HJM87708.1 ATPase domain-containing protein [Candidatus Thalassarchaeaceae archaeon]
MSDEEKGYSFELETDSLSDSLGRLLPKRSLYIVFGENGAGKSLIAQRLAYGLIANGVNLSLVTTELTTRGWLEQVDSLGYSLSDAADSGKFTLLSRFGVISDEVEEVVQISDILNSSAINNAEVSIIDRASAILSKYPDTPDKLLSELRSFCSEGRSLMLLLDPEELSDEIVRALSSSAEVVLEMRISEVGGGLNRTLAVTRFLRAMGPVQPRIGWRVEPTMGFIVDITAVS